jgi:hypothetical protein
VQRLFKIFSIHSLGSWEPIEILYFLTQVPLYLEFTYKYIYINIGQIQCLRRQKNPVTIVIVAQTTNISRAIVKEAGGDIDRYTVQL